MFPTRYSLAENLVHTDITGRIAPLASTRMSARVNLGVQEQSSPVGANRGGAVGFITAIDVGIAHGAVHSNVKQPDGLYSSPLYSTIVGEPLWCRCIRASLTYANMRRCHVLMIHVKLIQHGFLVSRLLCYSARQAD